MADHCPPTGDTWNGANAVSHQRRGHGIAVANDNTLSSSKLHSLYLLSISSIRTCRGIHPLDFDYLTCIPTGH